MTTIPTATCWRCEINPATHTDPMGSGARDEIRVCRLCAVDRFKVSQHYAHMGKGLVVFQPRGDAVL